MNELAKFEDDDFDDQHMLLRSKDMTVFDPVATFKDSYFSFGVLIVDPIARISSKIVILFDSENNLKITKAGRVIETLPPAALLDVKFGIKADKEILAVDNASSMKAFTITLTIDPAYSTDGEDTRTFLAGSKYDSVTIGHAIKNVIAGLPIDCQYEAGSFDRADHGEYGRDGFWTRQFLILANNRLFFFKNKGATVPYFVITYASLHDFYVAGPNNLLVKHHPLTGQVLEPSWLCSLRHGLDIEMLQFATEEIAQDWVDEVMDCVSYFKSELEDIERALEEGDDDGPPPPPPAPEVPIPPTITTHTIPTHVGIVHRDSGSQSAGSLVLLSDVSDAHRSQDVKCINISGMDNRQIIQFFTSTVECGYHEHLPDSKTCTALLNSAPTKPSIINHRSEGSKIAITNKGQVFVWGNGALGLGPHKKEQLIPMLLTSMLKDKVVSGSAGYNHVLLLTEKGDVYSYGTNNNYGQLGTSPDDANSLYPKKVPIPHPITYVYAMANSSFAVAANGSCYVWGANDDYVLGVNDIAQSNIPIEHPDLKGGIQQISISPDGTHGLALIYSDVMTKNGPAVVANIFSWGHNNRGQLGVGSAAGLTYSPTPVPIAKFTNVMIELPDHATSPLNPNSPNPVGIVATNGASAMFCSDGSCYIWGRSGPTGFGTDSRSPHLLKSSFVTKCILPTPVGFMFLTADNKLFASNSVHGIYPVPCEFNGVTITPLTISPHTAPAQLIIDNSPTTEPASAVYILSQYPVSAPDRPGATIASNMSSAPPKPPSGNPSELGALIGQPRYGRAMLPSSKIHNPFLESETTSQRANLAGQCVDVMLHNAKQKSLRSEKVDSKNVEADVLAAASIILNLHLAASTPDANKPVPPPPTAASEVPAMVILPPEPKANPKPPVNDDVPPPPPGAYSAPSAPPAPSAPVPPPTSVTSSAPVAPVPTPVAPAGRGFRNRNYGGANAAAPKSTGLPPPPADLGSLPPPPPGMGNLPPPPPM